MNYCGHNRNIFIKLQKYNVVYYWNNKILQITMIDHINVGVIYIWNGIIIYICVTD